MPLDRLNPIQKSTVGVSDFDTPDPSFLESLGASFRLENMIGSSLSRANINSAYGDINTPDPGYNVYQDEDMREIVDRYPDKFETVYNRNAAMAARARIEQEEKDRRTREASGWTGVGLDMVAGVADLPTLIPGGALIKGGKIGYSLLRSAATVGAAAGIGTAVQEAGLQATQELRTPTESALNIGGSVLLGGILGAGAGKFFSNAEWGRVSKQLESDLVDVVPNPDEVTQAIVSRMQSAGAAAVDEIDISDLGIGGPKAAELVARATAAARINPGIETMFSPARTVREVYGQMVDSPVYTKMNMEGRSLGPDVENSTKMFVRGATGDWVENSRSAYREARKAGYTGSRTEFNQAISYAARRGDVDQNGNEVVTRMAQYTRERIFDPLLRQAVDLGLLPEDIKVSTALSYVTRMWNRQRLIGEEARFREIAGTYFKEQIAKLPEGAGLDFVSKADMEGYVDDVVTGVFNNLTGRGTGEFPDWLVPIKRGPLKERTFNIPDELVEEFLENDMEAVVRNYTRKMSAEVELTRKFGRADMKDQMEAIEREYADLSKAAKTPKERIKLEKARKRDLTNLQAFRDMIRGTYKAADNASDWSKVTRAALTWNYIRLLGGVTLTSITDASRLIGVHGVRATMREALPALVKNVKAVNIAKADAKALGAVTERVLQSRLASLTDLTDPYAHGSRFERFLLNTSNIFSKATGLGYWNDTMKSIASVMTQNRMMRNALDWKGAGKTEQAYMAFLGIDEDMASRIAKQFQKYGMEEDGIYGANARLWDDVAAQRAWAAALNKDVDRTIITKGVADTPLWMKTNWGRLLFQFKSFGLASHQRVLIAGLQERPQRLAEQMVFATSLGMLISYLKYIERGDYEEANRFLKNPGLWVANGLDRSGILSIPFEISNTAEKLGYPGIISAAQAIAQDPDRGGSASRYASRGVAGALGGPTIGTIEDLVTISNQLLAGDLRKSGANAVIRQFPGATLPGFRTAIHVGVKPKFQEAVE